MPTVPRFRLVPGLAPGPAGVVGGMVRGGPPGNAWFYRDARTGVDGRFEFDHELNAPQAQQSPSLLRVESLDPRTR